MQVKLFQGQFDALVVFAYNVGLGMKGLEGSTLLAKVNAAKFDEALGQFALWNKEGGRPMKGLILRRAAESWLWRGASSDEAIRKGVSAA